MALAQGKKRANIKYNPVALEPTKEDALLVYSTRKYKLVVFKDCFVNVSINKIRDKKYEIVDNKNIFSNRGILEHLKNKCGDKTIHAGQYKFLVDMPVSWGSGPDACNVRRIDILGVRESRKSNPVYESVPELKLLVDGLIKIRKGLAVPCINGACCGVVAKNPPISTCTVCNTKQCTNCLCDWEAHKDMTCVQYRLKQLDVKLDCRIIKKLRSGKAQPCPNCLVLVEKNQGCNKIRCTCGDTWCWACGVGKLDKDNRDPADHYYDNICTVATGLFPDAHDTVIRDAVIKRNLAAFGDKINIDEIPKETKDGKDDKERVEKNEPKEEDEEPKEEDEEKENNENNEEKENNEEDSDYDSEEEEDENAQLARTLSNKEAFYNEIFHRGFVTRGEGITIEEDIAGYTQWRSDITMDIEILQDDLLEMGPNDEALIARTLQQIEIMRVRSTLVNRLISMMENALALMGPAAPSNPTVPPSVAKFYMDHLDDEEYANYLFEKIAPEVYDPNAETLANELFESIWQETNEVIADRSNTNNPADVEINEKNTTEKNTTDEHLWIRYVLNPFFRILSHF